MSGCRAAGPLDRLQALKNGRRHRNAVGRRQRRRRVVQHGAEPLRDLIGEIRMGAEDDGGVSAVGILGQAALGPRRHAEQPARHEDEVGVPIVGKDRQRARRFDEGPRLAIRGSREEREGFDVGVARSQADRVIDATTAPGGAEPARVHSGLA